MSNHHIVRREDQESHLDPVYHSLANLNGRINRMKKNELQRNLAVVGLNQKGVKEVLQKRLKNFYRKQKLESVQKFDDKQFYEYFVVIDFEATCEKKNPPEYLHEIIEFPAVLINSQSLEIVDKFCSYCKPELNPKLSLFCTQLTGISQSQVDEAPSFSSVLISFTNWLNDRNLLTSRKCCFVSDGSWDFSKFLNIQCCLSDVSYPVWAKKWMNLKKVFGSFYKLNKPKIEEMLTLLGMQFKGRPHCGLDDAMNLSRIVVKLLEDGCILQVNERLLSGKLCAITEKEKQKIKDDILINVEFATDSKTDKLVKDNMNSTKLNTSSQCFTSEVNKITEDIKLL